MASVSSMLCFAGVLLFFFGLLAGFGVPAFGSSRLGLSAHLTGVQSGTALVVLGLLWPHLSFWSGWSMPVASLLWVSFYVLFAGMTMGAVWATGRTLPVAGGGVAAAAWKERGVTLLLAVGALGSAAAIGAILAQWTWIAL